MNLSSTWTSREQSRVLDCSETRFIQSSMDSSKNSLRSVQKMSGLFDTDKASNTTVASKASKPAALDINKMDINSIGGFMPDDDLGGIIADMPFDLTEEDYLDSFVDLSNFLLPENSMKGSSLAVDSEVDNGEVKETIPTDFSGIISHLNTEPAVFEVTPEVVTSTSSSLRKRKHVDYEEVVVDDFVINVVDQPIDGECSMADHDYVSKKPRLAEPVTTVKASHVTSSIQSKVTPTYKSTDKYRERRDKNNEASRRSRQIRKQKFIEMDSEANDLEVKNEALRKKIIELEALAKTMKAMLIKKMTDK
ncbi:thyrotroph embryonic factor-like [Mercenaria mercenaria]|uniref:thyrotroph embryonic factor-like n=1 Tax=Mercenaria mercenaria TaxID=6596 RepID=UPI00234EC4B2|nr:thyrotroph embryonic factor-like [Mercenaria mercenaria]